MARPDPFRHGPAAAVEKIGWLEVDPDQVLDYVVSVTADIARAAGSRTGVAAGRTLERDRQEHAERQQAERDEQALTGRYPTVEQRREQASARAARDLFPPTDLPHQRPRRAAA